MALAFVFTSSDLFTLASCRKCLIWRNTILHQALLTSTLPPVNTSSKPNSSLKMCPAQTQRSEELPLFFSILFNWVQKHLPQLSNEWLMTIYWHWWLLTGKSYTEGGQTQHCGHEAPGGRTQKGDQGDAVQTFLRLSVTHSVLKDGLTDPIILCILRPFQNSTSPLTSTSLWSKSSELTPQSDESSTCSKDSRLARTNVQRVPVHRKREQCVKHFHSFCVIANRKRNKVTAGPKKKRQFPHSHLCFLRVSHRFWNTKNETFLISNSHGCISFKLVFLCLSEWKFWA